MARRFISASVVPRSSLCASQNLSYFIEYMLQAGHSDFGSLCMSFMLSPIERLDLKVPELLLID
jgi:hypothetical protein